MHRRGRKSPPKRKKLSPPGRPLRHPALVIGDVAEEIMVQLPLSDLLKMAASDEPQDDRTAELLESGGLWTKWVERNIFPRHDTDIILKIPFAKRWRYYARLHGKPEATEVYVSTCCGGQPLYSRFYAVFNSSRPITELRMLSGWPGVAAVVVDGELGWLCSMFGGVFSAHLVVRPEHQIKRRYVSVAEKAKRAQKGFEITLFLLDTAGQVSYLNFFVSDGPSPTSNELEEFWDAKFVEPRHAEQFGDYKVVQLTADYFINNRGFLFKHHKGIEPTRVDNAIYLSLFRTEAESPVSEALLGVRLEDITPRPPGGPRQPDRPRLLSKTQQSNALERPEVPRLLDAARMIPSVLQTQGLPTLMIFEAETSNLRVGNTNPSEAWKRGQRFSTQTAAGLATLHDRGGAFWDTRGRLYTWAAFGEWAGNGSHTRRTILPDLSLTPLLAKGIPDFVVGCENALVISQCFVALAVAQPRSRTIISLLSKMSESDLELLVAAFLLPLPREMYPNLLREALLRESPPIVLQLAKQRVVLRKHVEELQSRTLLELIRDAGGMLGQLRKTRPTEEQAALWEYVETSGLSELYETRFDVVDIRYALAALATLGEPWL